jgi:hypothetical protein
MNDVREAIDRVGSRFDQRGRFDDLSRRRNRARARRRITGGAAAAMVAAGGLLFAIRALPASTPGPPSKLRVAAMWPLTSVATPSAAMAVGPSCPTPSGDSPPQVVFSSISGKAGSTVEVSGTFETGELWLQLWWNADGDAVPDKVAPPPWPPTGPDLRFVPSGPGPVVNLASIEGPAGTGQCAFRTTVTVPDVDPGTYEVVWAFGALNPPRGETGYYLFTSSIQFEVTR